MTRRLAAPGHHVAIAIAMLLVAGCGGSAGAAPSQTQKPSAVAAGSSPTPALTPAPTSTPTPSASPSAPPVLPLAELDGWIAYSIGDSSHADIRLVRTDGSENHAVAQDAGPRSIHPEWLPDGSGFLFEQVVGRDDVKSIWSWDLATNASTELLPCADPCVSRQAPAPSADGTRIAYETNDGPVDDVAIDGQVAPIPAHCGLQVMTLATRKTEEIVTGRCGIDEWRAPRWSPAGDLAYFRTHQTPRGGPVDRTEVVVRDMRSGKESVAYYWDGEDQAYQLEWSPDGTWLVFSALGGLQRIRPDGTGGEVLVEPGQASLHPTAYHPRFLDDGRSLSYNWSIAPQGVITSVKLFVMPTDGRAATQVLPEGPNGTFLHYNWGSLQPTP